MFGWFRADAARASCSRRRFLSGSPVRSGGNIFSATVRPAAYPARGTPRPCLPHPEARGFHKDRGDRRADVPFAPISITRETRPFLSLEAKLRLPSNEFRIAALFSRSYGED